MNNTFLIFLALLALTTAGSVPELISTGDGISEEVFNQYDISTRGIILSSQGKKALENFINHMKTGWPESGIPPLIPYKKDQMVFQLKNSMATAQLKISNFTVNDLDNVDIRQLRIDYTLKHKVKFNFLFPKLVVTGKLFANASIEVLKGFGINLKRNVTGDMEMFLENVTLQGSFKYTMPILLGSMKIYKFNGRIIVPNIVSKIDGVLGDEKLNAVLNKAVEEALMKLISVNEDNISEMLKDTLVPFLNEKLKGKNIRTIIGSIIM